MAGNQVLNENKEKEIQPRFDEDIRIESTSRGHWSSQIEFFLCCLGYAVGFGNIWRFPYLCMRNGGGAFLIPYFVSLLLCGIPLICLELSVGQFAGLSCLQIWSICPLFQGLGVSMLFVCGLSCVYLNAILTWTIYYLIQSFTLSVPWSDCGHSWNTPLCLMRGNVSNGMDPTNISAADVNRSLQVTWYEGHPGEMVDNENASVNASVHWTSPAEEFWQ